MRLDIWPFNRKQQRAVTSRMKQRSYAGAAFGRLVNDWVTSTTSMDAELRSSLVKLRDRARQLGRDNDYMRSFLREVQNNVIGQGISFQAQVRQERGQRLNEKINDEIEAKWCKWTRKENCHVAGTLNFQEIERLIIRNVAESGEVIVRKVFQKFGKSRIPLALEVIEPDLLDENMNGVSSEGNEIRMGVEVDQWQRPVAYHFRSAHPGDLNAHSIESRVGRHKRVPAGEIMHLFISERGLQSRGAPWIASAIMRLRHMQGYEEAEVIHARSSAAIMGFIQTPEGEPSADGVVEGEKVYDFEPGVFKHLAPGETVEIPQVQRPGGQFDPFMERMLRGTCAGIGASYEAVSKDYSKSNYSSSRLSLLTDRDQWKVLQRWMIDNFHQPVLEAWLDMAVLSGELNLKGYEINPDPYQSVKWMPRGWNYVDPQKEVEAFKEGVRSGFMTQADVVSQGGGDLEELMTQREREIKRAKELGLSFDTHVSEQKKENASPFAKEETE
jgi:lambda family phage portal protein